MAPGLHIVTLRSMQPIVPDEWRPCCGSCRGERLLVLFDERPAMTSHTWRCEDCGALWDGSALTAAEASERGPAPPPPPSTPEGKAAPRGC